MHPLDFSDKFNNQEFCEKVSKRCVSTFSGLGKSGKPGKNEWTVLSCIVKSELKNEGCSLEVVALGTGSKCIGGSELPRVGDRLHDSHAEIIARRSFKLYLLEQLRHSLKGKESIFLYNKGKGFTLRENVSFHFYCSNMPCGDASIFPKEEEGCIEYTSKDDPHSGDIYFPKCEEEPATKKRKGSGDLSSKNQSSEEAPIQPVEIAETETATGLIPTDLHRTGAKCVRSEVCDPREEGLNYHVTGALRTKPGRGDRTLSHSCSDKMFRWTVLGVQGALLMLFLDDPIYLQTVIIGSCPFNREAFQRALYTRFEEKMKTMEFILPFHLQTPRIMQSKVPFPYAKPVLTPEQSKVSHLRPSPTSLIWSGSPIHRSKPEVSVDGKRLGTTRKNIDSYKSRVSICRMELLRSTFDLLNCIQEEDKALYTSRFGKFACAQNLAMSYGDVKKCSILYQSMWNRLRNVAVMNWTDKPANIKTFSLDKPK